MDWTDVARRIAGGEDARTEFKQSLSNFGSIGRTLCAFANGSGGLLVLGVNDSGEIAGLREDPDRVQERLTSLLQSGCNKPVPAECGVRRADQGWVHWVDVPRHLRGFEPFSRSGRFWIRRGRSTVAPSSSELQELMNTFGLVLTEKLVIPSATVDDIDIGAFQDFMRAQGREMDEEPQPPIEDDLRNASVCGAWEGAVRPTLYGLAVFGRNLQGHPQTGSFMVKCAAYAGQDRAGDVLSVGEAKGRLEDQVHRALGWFKSLGHKEAYSGLYRTDIPLLPDGVVREALVNGVIHRDYAIVGSSVMLEVFDDRVDVTSPGVLPNHMSVDEARLGGAPRSRNELMANAMVVARLMEQRGRGWLLMRRLMRDFNGTEPLLANSRGGGYVRATFPLAQ